MDEELNWFSEDPVNDFKEVVKKPHKIIKPEVKYDAKKFQMDAEENKIDIKSESELISKVAVSSNDKLNLLEERDKLIRSKLVKSIKPAVTLKGTCPDMCPEKERIMREVRNMIASYETTSENRLNHDLAVKEYKRSSADQEEPLSHDLRPESVLTMTMEYLIINIMGKIDNEDENIEYWFDFCWGRLRAIRKDIIQQQLCDIKTVQIVEQCARYHILCFDRLWDAPKTVFDFKINSETLMNCLQSLMHMYEDLKKHNVTCPNEAEFKAYLILLKLNSGFLLSEYQQYSEYLQRSKEVNDAVKIHTAYSNGMYATYFKLLDKTSYLNSCLMQRFFAQLRTNALNVIVRAFCPPNNKISRLPVKYLEDALKFDSTEDTILFCEAFSIGVTDNDSTFLVSRNSLVFPENLSIINTPSSLIIKKRMPVAEAVYGRKDLPVYIPHKVHTSFTPDSTLKISSLDASDQEEKMLRDTVERQLILKKIISEPVESFTDSLVMEKDESIEIEMEDQTDIYEDIEDYSTDMDQDFVDNTSIYSESSVKSISSPELSDDPSPVHMPIFQFKWPAPKTDETDSSKFPPVSPTVPKKLTSPIFSVSTFPKKSQPPSPLPLPKPTSVPQLFFQETPKLVKPKEKTDEENMIMMKLRKKLGDKMKKRAARKCAKIWRNKVEKIKRMRQSEKNVICHVPIHDYAKLWGNNCQKQKLTFERLKKRKIANLLVTAILHTNLVDQVDNQVKKVNATITQILSNTSISHAHNFGNIAQPHPVFWKVIIALPEKLSGGSTFPDKLRKWCQNAFYPNSDKNLGQVYFNYVNFVPIFTSVNIIEGLSDIENLCGNTSALVLVTAKEWEQYDQTIKRLNEILLKTTSKIPVSILSMKEKVQIKHKNILFLHTSVWDSTDSLVESMSILAHKTPMYNLKVESLGFMVEVASENFLDALHVDRFIDDDLYVMLTNPNRIIYLYNLFLEKIEDEIIQCCTFNLYGTAYEFKGDLSEFNLFPQHYNEPNFKSMLRHRIDLLKLPYIHEDFTTSTGLLTTYGEYFKKLNCSHILSKIMRMINPPDDDENVTLVDFLKNISWIPIVEVIIKENIRNRNMYNFNVVYRGDKINDMVKNHWWLQPLPPQIITDAENI